MDFLEPEMTGKASPEYNEEEHIYDQLFRQCDRKGVGMVDVGELVDYIRHMQLQVQHPDEEVFESHESSGMEYNLQVLQSMLECNCDADNKINKSTFLHIIRKWVNDVRDRCVPPPSPARASLEVSHLTDSSSPGQEDRNISYGSYGVNDSQDNQDGHRQSYTQQEMADLISKYQHDIKQLNQRNRELVLQHDGSEENLKDCQSQNRALQQRLNEIQASMGLLKDLEELNSELSRTVTETKRDNDSLERAKKQLSKELDLVNTELARVSTQLLESEMDRSEAKEEANNLHDLLLKAKESEIEIQSEYQAKLAESRSQMELMNQELNEANALNVQLKMNISELEGQLHQLQSQEPASSTPFRPARTPCLHDELQENLLGDGSFISPLRYGEVDPDVSPPLTRVEEVSRSTHRESFVSPAVESFTKLLEETDSKIQLKHSLILRDLEDLMLQQSPGTSNSHRETTSFLSQGDQSLNEVETKLKTLMRRKNQFKNENNNLRNENTDLKERLKLLKDELTAKYEQHLANSIHRQSLIDRGTSPFAEPPLASSTLLHPRLSNGNYSISSTVIGTSGDLHAADTQRLSLDHTGGRSRGSQAQEEGVSFDWNRPSLSMNGTTLPYTAQRLSTTPPMAGTHMNETQTGGLSLPATSPTNGYFSPPLSRTPARSGSASPPLTRSPQNGSPLLPTMTSGNRSTSPIFNRSPPLSLTRISRSRSPVLRSRSPPPIRNRSPSPALRTSIYFPSSLTRTSRGRSRSTSPPPMRSRSPSIPSPVTRSSISTSPPPMRSRSPSSPPPVTRTSISTSPPPMRSRSPSSPPPVTRTSISTGLPPMRTRSPSSPVPVTRTSISSSPPPMRSRSPSSPPPMRSRSPSSPLPVTRTSISAGPPPMRSRSPSSPPPVTRTSISTSPPPRSRSPSSPPPVTRTSINISPLPPPVTRSSLSRSPPPPLFTRTSRSRSHSPVLRIISRSPPFTRSRSPSPLSTRLPLLSSSPPPLGGRTSPTRLSTGRHSTSPFFPINLSPAQDQSTGLFSYDPMNDTEPTTPVVKPVARHRQPQPLDSKDEEILEEAIQALTPQNLNQSETQVTSFSYSPSKCGYSDVYLILKNSVLLLLLTILILALLVLIVLSHDAIESCGSFCPHSPIQLIYSFLGPLIHYTKSNTAI